MYQGGYAPRYVKLELNWLVSRFGKPGGYHCYLCASTDATIALNHTQSCPLEGIPVLILELSVKSCPVGPELHPSFEDASSPPGCCPQSQENLLNTETQD
jgi:hypothetical protein